MLHKLRHAYKFFVISERFDTRYGLGLGLGLGFASNLHHPGREFDTKSIDQTPSKMFSQNFVHIYILNHKKIKTILKVPQ